MLTGYVEDARDGKGVAVYLNGQGIPGRDVRGQRVTDDSFVLCFNAHYEPIEFTLPPKEFGSDRPRVLRRLRASDAH